MAAPYEAVDLNIRIVYTMVEELSFEWNEVKRRANIAKHGIDFFELRPAFWDPDRIQYPAHQRGHTELRYVLLARALDRILHIVLTHRGNATRIISARHAHWKERALYERGRNRLDP
jgi:uncharacterized DUF497 family protein